LNIKCGNVIFIIILKSTLFISFQKSYPHPLGENNDSPFPKAGEPNGVLNLNSPNPNPSFPSSHLRGVVGVNHIRGVIWPGVKTAVNPSLNSSVMKGGGLTSLNSNLSLPSSHFFGLNEENHIRGVIWSVFNPSLNSSVIKGGGFFVLFFDIF
jgi:hypothetical protein